MIKKLELTKLDIYECTYCDTTCTCDEVRFIPSYKSNGVIFSIDIVCKNCIHNHLVDDYGDTIEMSDEVEKMTKQLYGTPVVLDMTLLNK